MRGPVSLPSRPSDIAALEARIPILERTRARRHRLANWTFLASGVGFGTAVYLARTRLSTFVGSGKLVGWGAIVAAAVAAFATAARLHARALRVDEELAELRARLAELRAAGSLTPAGPAPAKTAGPPPDHRQS